MDTKKEQILIEKSRLGDEDSFNILIDNYKNYIFKIILSFVKDYYQAENIYQEVTLKIYLSLEEYKNKSFKAYIARIATNQSIDYLRKKRIESYNTIENMKDETIEKIVDDKLVTEDIVVKKENISRVIEVLKDMDIIYSEVLRLFFIESLTYDEISKRYKINKRTVETRIYRGKKIFKKIWGEKYGTH